MYGNCKEHFRGLDRKFMYVIKHTIYTMLLDVQKLKPFYPVLAFQVVGPSVCHIRHWIVLRAGP